MTKQQDINKEQIREIVSKIVREILSKRQLKSPTAKKLLILFTGSLTNYDSVISQLRAIILADYNVTLVLSESFSKLKSPDEIQKELNPDRVLTNLNNYEIVEEVKNADLILVPFLTRNTVAKILNAITDSLPTNLIFDALLLNKTIIAVRDGADPEILDCIPCSTPDAPAIITSLMKKNLELFKQVGVELIKSEQLEDAVEDFFSNKKQSSPKIDAQAKLQRQIITGEDIKKLLKNKEKSLYVSANAIITDIAKEMMKKEGIDIVRL